MRPRRRALMFGLAVAFTLWGGVVAAHAEIYSVRITPNVNGAEFQVDGTTYSGPIVVLWPEGSKHTLSVRQPIQIHQQLKTIFSFRGWSSNQQLNPDSSGIVLANRDLTSIGVSFDVSYAVTVSYFDCSSTEAPACPGTVNGVPGNWEKYLPKGSTVTLTASPNPGWVFIGWGQFPGVPPATPFSPVFSFVLNQPQVVSPQFRHAANVTVTIDTSPRNLQVLADRTPVPDPRFPYPSPPTFDWGWDSIHTIGTIPVQYDSQGKLWIFDSWSDGGAINHNVTMASVTTTAITYTARFVPGAVVTFVADPPQLKLRVDNRDNWQAYTFQWAAGTTHSVSAPLEQTDVYRHKYRFQGWSDGSPAAFKYTVASAPADARLIATYKPVGQITVSSNAAGLPVKVDGQDCATPCNIEREVGASVRISAPELYSQSDASRLVFQGWSDGGGAEHDVTAPESPLRVEAAYGEQNRLAVGVEPSEGAKFRITPDAPDGYYEKGTLVTLQVNAEPGNRFVGWAGDLTGAKSTAVLQMNAPKRVMARLEAVPYVKASGVRNGAAETPVDAVAPGSIISILGLNLAPDSESSPDNPLAQTLAGVTVRMGDRLLPLAMVSPTEIRAQLPSDIPVGSQTLAVKWGDKPEAVADFEVGRNVPGLFFKDVDGKAFAVGVRENGKPLEAGGGVTAGETITLLGTGFGPYVMMPPDGFALPEAPGFQLADPAEVLFGEAVLTPAYAGAGTQTAGLNAVRFQVPVATTAGELQVFLRVNGVQSNTVVLRVE